MRKLSALVAFIIQQLNFVAAENVSSFHIVDVYKPSGEYVFNESFDDAVCLYDQEYSAVVRIERFPCARYPPEVVFGLVSCWLLENDPEPYRYKIDSGANNELIPLANPDVNTEEESDETIALEIIIPFREPVFGIKDQDGILLFQDKNYRLADATIEEERFEQHYIRNRS